MNRTACGLGLRLREGSAAAWAATGADSAAHCPCIDLLQSQRTSLADAPVTLVNGRRQLMGQSMKHSLHTQPLHCQRMLQPPTIGSAPEPRSINLPSCFV